MTRRLFFLWLLLLAGCSGKRFVKENKSVNSSDLYSMIVASSDGKKIYGTVVCNRTIVTKTKRDLYEERYDFDPPFVFEKDIFYSSVMTISKILKIPFDLLSLKTPMRKKVDDKYIKNIEVLSDTAKKEIPDSGRDIYIQIDEVSGGIIAKTDQYGRFIFNFDDYLERCGLSDYPSDYVVRFMHSKIAHPEIMHIDAVDIIKTIIRRRRKHYSVEKGGNLQDSLELTKGAVHWFFELNAVREAYHLWKKHRWTRQLLAALTGVFLIKEALVYFAIEFIFWVIFKIFEHNGYRDVYAPECSY